MLDLQGLTDDLCEKLGRSIAVDNQHIEVIAASAQIGVIDQVRSDAILNRRTTPEIVEYVASLGIAEAVDPVQVPPHPTLHTLPRWCFPLRQGGRLLGYLWVIDEPALTQEELDLAREYATEIQGILARNIEHADAILRSSVQLTTDLLREGDRQALDMARRSGMLVTLGQTTIWSLVVSSERSDRAGVTTADLFELLADMTSTTHPGSFIGAPIEDRLAVVTKNTADGRDFQPLLAAIRLSCRRKRLLLQAVGGADLTDDLNPQEGLERANFTASVARWDGREDLRRWEALGAWTLVKGHSWSDELVRSVSPSAYALLQAGKPDLCETLLAYLDRASSIPSTCEALHLHRATLYYRLGRIKEIAGEPIFSSGWEQSSAHLALRIWKAGQTAQSAGEPFSAA